MCGEGITTHPLFYTYTLLHFKRRLLSTTDTELNAIAPLAIIGFNKGPPNTHSNPAANGMLIRLYIDAQNKF